jgi:beta-phosphoglucomutase-like phosphatase (HAD superfamily)
MQLDIPAGEFAGYIFDLDGTLVDTMPLHYRAWDQAMREAGLPHRLDEDLFYSLGGVPTRKVAELIGKHYGPRSTLSRYFTPRRSCSRQSRAMRSSSSPWRNLPGRWR